MKPFTSLLFVAAASVAIGSTSGCLKEACTPTTPALSQYRSDAVDEAVLGREIRTLFGRSPAGGAVPRDPSWSPDGTHVAYLRDSYDTDGVGHGELWRYDTKQKLENPVFPDKSGRISDYGWCGADRLIAAAGGDLYLIMSDTSAVRLTDTEAVESSPVASPDCARTAFVRDGDIYVLDMKTGEETRLTDAASPRRLFGEVTWLYGEEFDTERGMGWSPDGRYLWFYDTDLGKVPFREISQISGPARRMPYPRPGEGNPAVRVAAVNLDGPSPVVAYLETGPARDVYLPRVIPHPDGARVAVARLDRLQTRVEWLLCPFVGGGCTTMVSEQDPRFVNLLADPLFAEGGDALLFLSERSGFAQIYKKDIKSGAESPVTAGEWTVTRIDAVDAAMGTVFFTADIEDPLQYRLYRVPLSGGEIQGCPGLEGSHSALFSPDATQYLDTHSDLSRPPRMEVRSVSGGESKTLAAQDVGQYDASDDIVNELFSIPSPGGPLNALLTRPAAMDRGVRYPVVVLVYGGPGAQLAVRRFHTTYQPFRDLLARRGILVFTVDGRGSAGRGHDFEAAIRLSLGKAELADQLFGVEYLVSKPYVDPARIGIFGWSYGGYMALNGLLRSDVFSMGIAVAPVTDWRWYDSAYTERYMQRPKDNPAGYRDSALVPLSSRLRVPLLLVHGIADDNVHFIHSAKLFEALTAAERPFESMFFPGKSHRLSGPAARVHLFSRILRFIEDNL